MDSLNIMSATNDRAGDQGAKSVWPFSLKLRIPKWWGQASWPSCTMSGPTSTLGDRPDNQLAAAWRILAGTLEHSLRTNSTPAFFRRSQRFDRDQPRRHVVSGRVTAKAERAKKAINDAAESIVARLLHQIQDPRQEG
jgi:hypothetical protein